MDFGLLAIAIAIVAYIAYSHYVWMRSTERSDDYVAATKQARLSVEKNMLAVEENTAAVRKHSELLGELIAVNRQLFEKQNQANS
jgi:hypothetical protein